MNDFVATAFKLQEYQAVSTMGARGRTRLQTPLFWPRLSGLVGALAAAVTESNNLNFLFIATV